MKKLNGNNRIWFAVLMLLCCNTLFAQTDTGYKSILRQMQYAARQGLLDKYYPRNLDSVHGGYLSTFTFDLQPTGAQDKMIVTQARHVWSTAKAALFYKDTSYLGMARHGFNFLQNKMWDREFGGFFNLVSRSGEPKGEGKTAYGNAFAIYALAAYYGASKDTAALSLVKKAFAWLEQHSHDGVHKGYFQHLQRNGKPLLRTANTPSTSDLGYKDQNSSIHLLEAFTELYHVWPDPLVKVRLQEMLDLLQNKIIHPKGYLQLFFTPNWKPVSFSNSPRSEVLKHRNLDHVSFGHDVETAYLMQEASEALHGYRHQQTMLIGKRMVDHALQHGWDKALGGFYDQGYYFKDGPAITIIKESKNWWSQAEGLNTLLIFSKLYPADSMQYAARFKQLWQYCQTYLIDHEHGDWYEEGLDKEPQRKTGLKAHIWKGTYHNFRALANCITLLEKTGK